MYASMGDMNHITGTAEISVTRKLCREVTSQLHGYFACIAHSLQRLPQAFGSCYTSPVILTDVIGLSSTTSPFSKSIGQFNKKKSSDTAPQLNLFNTIIVLIPTVLA
jgi:hypothetical protein